MRNGRGDDNISQRKETLKVWSQRKGKKSKWEKEEEEQTTFSITKAIPDVVVRLAHNCNFITFFVGEEAFLSYSIVLNGNSKVFGERRYHRCSFLMTSKKTRTTFVRVRSWFLGFFGCCGGSSLTVSLRFCVSRRTFRFSYTCV